MNGFTTLAIDGFAAHVLAARVPAADVLAADVLAAAPKIPATAPTDPAPGWFGFLSNPLLLIVGVFLVTTLLFGNRGKKADEKARTEQLKNLKRGDRIQTIGGIQGAVVRTETDRIEVKVDESSNVKIWFARNAIARVVEADKGEAK